MKTRSKALLLTLCAVLLVTASVLGTMAYLTSTDEVVNTFTVGSVAITLDETDVDGSTPNAERDKANAYKLMPGHTYTKDPIVHVASTSEDCYLFVKVVNEIAAIEGGTTVAAQMAAKGWVAVEGATGVYVYTQDDALAVVAGGRDVTVFDNFTINGAVKGGTKPADYTGNELFLGDYDNKTITVTAYAIQADGFADKTASEIWTAAGFNS